MILHFLLVVHNPNTILCFQLEILVPTLPCALLSFLSFGLWSAGQQCAVVVAHFADAWVLGPCQFERAREAA